MNESLPASFQQRRIKEVLILFTGIALLFVISTYLLHEYAGKGWIESFFIACFGLIALGLVVLMLVRLLDRRQTGPVLLELGPAPPLEGTSKFVVVSQFLLGVFFVTIGWSDPAVSYNVWLGGALILSPIALLMRVGSSYQICENGPFLSGILVKWTNIQRFEWDGQHLWIRSKYKVIRFSDCRITVPEAQKESVDELMRKHVADAESGNPVQS